MLPNDLALSQAIKLLGEDRLTDEQIASQIGISRRTLARWKHRPGVREQIQRGRALAKQRFWRNVRRKANWMKRQKLLGLPIV